MIKCAISKNREGHSYPDNFNPSINQSINQSTATERSEATTFWQASGCGEEESHGEFSCGVSQHIRCVTNRNVKSPAFLEINVIKSNWHGTDDFQTATWKRKDGFAAWRKSLFVCQETHILHSTSKCYKLHTFVIQTYTNYTHFWLELVVSMWLKYIRCHEQ